MLPLLALACTPPDPDDGPRDRPTTPTDSTPTTGDTASPPTGETASTGDTGGTPPIDLDCEDLPTGPVPYTQAPIVTTEDFDFDALGYLVYSDWSNFVAADHYGNEVVVAPGIFDTRGIQFLSDGNLVAAYIWEGRVGFTDRVTGASYTLLSNLSGPNALEVGDGDLVFVSETGGTPRVRAFDVATLTETQIASGFVYPNGIALNDAQDVLYVADSTAGVYKVPKNGDGTWGPQELLFTPPGGESYDGIEVDACGNVYTVNFYNGELHRFDPDTLDHVLLLDLDEPGAFLYNSIRWGSDRGGWRRDVLYVTNRNEIFGVEVGVPGRRQPIDAMP